MTGQKSGAVAILGIFVADTSFRAARQPKMGETLIGKEFKLGPGGKGSNQAVAVARLGTQVSIITSLGNDDFAEIALNTWNKAGVDAVVTRVADNYTGAAYIFIEEESGNNAIIVCPGAASTISAEQVEKASATIENADVFITQLEQPVEAARRGLEIAHTAGVTTIFNPAPAVPVDDRSPECFWGGPAEVDRSTGIELDR